MKKEGIHPSDVDKCFGWKLETLWPYEVVMTNENIFFEMCFVMSEKQAILWCGNDRKKP